MIRRGELPLWKSNPGLGSPLLGDGMSAPLEPLLALTYLVPEESWPWAMDGVVLLKFLLAGWFTYLLVRRLGASFFPAIFAGAAYMLSYQIVLYGNSPELPPQMLAPLLLYVFDRLAEKPSLGSATATAAVIAWTIWSGLPEASFLSLMMGGFWYLYRAFWKVKETGFTRSAWRQWLGIGLVAILAGVALSAWFWLPVVENIGISVSNHPIGQGLKTFGPRGLVFTILSPFRPVTKLPFFGVTVLILAVTGAITLPRMGTKTRAAAFFAIFSLVFGLEIYSIPPFRWIGYLPGYNQTTIPQYMIASVVLSLTVLSALAIDRLMGSGRTWIPVAISGLVLAGFCVYFVEIDRDFQAAFTDSARLFANLLVTLLLLTGIVILILFFNLRNSKSAIPIALLVVLLAEVFGTHRHIQRPLRVDPYREAPYITFLKSIQQPYRIMAFDATLFPDLSMVYGIDDLRYMDPIDPVRRDLFMEGLVASPKSKDRVSGLEETFKIGRILDLLNVRYYLVVEDFPENVQNAYGGSLTTIYDGEVKILENPQALSRAFILFQAEPVADLQAAINRLDDAGFDPLTTAVIEQAQWTEELQLLSRPSAIPWQAAQITQRGANSMAIQTNTTSPGILVISETYFPGWQASVDGKAVDLFAVDGLLRGIYLPAGKHQVNLVYRPRSFIIGVSLCLGTMLLLAGAWILTWQRKAPRAQSR